MAAIPLNLAVAVFLAYQMYSEWRWMTKPLRVMTVTMLVLNLVWPAYLVIRAV